MYYENQPYFINSVIKIETGMKPFSLLKFLNQIEKKLGRVREFKNSPRTIDLDILYYDRVIIQKERLKIPHPKIYERAFVLKPLSDIDKKFKDPGKNKNSLELLSLINFKSEDIIKIPQKYEEIYDFFNSISPRDKNDFTTKYVRDSLKLLGCPEDRCGHIIHITGSSGKTTTAKYINDILLSNNFNVCLYTSPHIHDIRERIMINSKKIGIRTFYSSLIKIISSSRYILSPFEYITVIAVLEFSRNNPHFSVIEVGMGGKYDATNVFDNSFSVFTKITREHQKYLGRNIKDIALNKAGIIKERGNVFISAQNSKAAVDVIKREAIKKNCRVHIFKQESGNDFNSINFEFAKFVSSKIIKLNNKIKFKNFDCRNQIIKYKGIDILLDGAHTPVSIKMLVKNLNGSFPICLCSFMNDKKIKEMLEIIKKNRFEIFLSGSYNQRSFNPFNWREYGLCFDNPEDALKRALSYKKNILVCGSLYFCSDILKIIKKEKINYFKELI
jgi:dihydrofolate synthase/folylpolyglutamate synthase